LTCVAQKHRCLNFLICLDATKFVLPSVFITIKDVQILRVKTRATTKTRFFQEVLAREPASFLQEKVIVIFIPLRVLGRVVAETCYEMLEVLRPVEGLTSFNEDNSGNFSGEKSRMKLSRVSTFREYAKRTLSQISYS